MAKNKFKLFNIFLLMGVLLIGIASASYSSEFNSIQKDLGNSLGSETGSERGDGFESEFGQEKELTKEELEKMLIEEKLKNRMLKDNLINLRIAINKFLNEEIKKL